MLIDCMIPPSLPPSHYFLTCRHQMKQSASRAKLPNRPTDFQVRWRDLSSHYEHTSVYFTPCLQVQVHILEARNLIGGEVNSVVKVLCGEEINHTTIQKGTNNPFWDEVCTQKQVNVLVLVRPQRHSSSIPLPRTHTQGAVLQLQGASLRGVWQGGGDKGVQCQEYYHNCSHWYLQGNCILLQYEPLHFSMSLCFISTIHKVCIVF